MNRCNNYIKGTLPYLFLIVCSACFSEELPSTNQPLIPTEIFWCDANNPSPIESEDKRSLIRRWCDKLVSLHDKTSYQYMSMAYSLDRYFSGEEIENSSNDSYLKLDFKNTLYKSGEQTDGLSLSVRVELPNTEKHFKLIFNTDPEEDKTLEQQIQNKAEGQRIQKENAIAGIEYTPGKTESKWDHSFAAGVKIRVHPLPFIRYKFGKKWQLNEDWKSNFKQSFWNYQDDGIGATSNLGFGRPLTKKDFFSADTQAEYLDKDNKYYYAETFSNTHRISENSSIRYSASVLGESQPTSQISNYVLGIQYRKNLYKDWLLLSISPQLSYPREENWKPTPSLTLNLQIYFTE